MYVYIYMSYIYKNIYKNLINIRIIYRRIIYAFIYKNYKNVCMYIYIYIKLLQAGIICDFVDGEGTGECVGLE